MFVFFGLVAVSGTAYVQVGRVDWATLLTGVAIGALACAILVANNLRDIAGDTRAGKRTLATRLGQQGTRRLYAGLAGTGRGGHRRGGRADLALGAARARSDCCCWSRPCARCCPAGRVRRWSEC